jgi:hypothetical protein
LSQPRSTLVSANSWTKMVLVRQQRTTGSSAVDEGDQQLLWTKAAPPLALAGQRVDE